ncbi:MAG: phosphatase PAP2 family protein [Hominenteromicrobium sp.]
MHLEGIPAFDAAVMEFIQTHFHTPAADAVFPVLTALGEAGLIWIILAVTLLFFRKTRATGMLVLVTMLLTFISGELVLKNIVCRPRPCAAFPDIPLLIARPNSYSFPSGHSASSFAAAVMLTLRHRKWGWIALVPAALIAFSRVFLFVHYPTDVLAGALLGTLFAFAVYAVYRRKSGKALTNG